MAKRTPTKRVRKPTSLGDGFISEPPKKQHTVNRAKAKSKEDGDGKQYKMKDGKFIYQFTNYWETPTPLRYYRNSKQDIEVCNWLTGLPSYQNPFEYKKKNSGSKRANKNEFLDVIGRSMWADNGVGELGEGPMYLKDYAPPEGVDGYWNWLGRLLKRIRTAHKQIDSKTHGNNKNGVEEPTEWEQAVIDCMDRVDEILKEREAAVGPTSEMKNNLVNGLLSQMLTPAKQCALNNAQGTELQELPDWITATNDSDSDSNSDSNSNSNSNSTSDDDDDDAANKPNYVNLFESDEDSNAVSLEHQEKPKTKKDKDKDKHKKTDKKMDEKMEKKKKKKVKRKKGNDEELGTDFMKSLMDDAKKDNNVLQQMVQSQIQQQNQQQQQQQQQQQLQQFYTPNSSYENSKTTPSTMTTESTTPLTLTAAACQGKIKDLKEQLSEMEEGELTARYREMIKKYQDKMLQLMETDFD